MRAEHSLPGLNKQGGRSVRWRLGDASFPTEGHSRIVLLVGVPGAPRGQRNASLVSFSATLSPLHSPRKAARLSHHTSSIASGASTGPDGEVLELHVPPGDPSSKTRVRGYPVCFLVEATPELIRWATHRQDRKAAMDPLSQRTVCCVSRRRRTVS